MESHLVVSQARSVTTQGWTVQQAPVMLVSTAAAARQQLTPTAARLLATKETRAWTAATGRQMTCVLPATTAP